MSMMAWVAALALGQEEPDDDLLELDVPASIEPSADEVAAREQLRRVDALRRETLFVVDAWVVKRVVSSKTIQITIGSTVPAGGVPGQRKVYFCATYGRPPAIERRRDGRVISTEWVVVDGLGQRLGASRFAALTGESGHEPEGRGRSVLEGVQLAYDRQEVERIAAAHNARVLAASGLGQTELSAARSLAVGALPPPEWSNRRPDPIEEG